MIEKSCLAAIKNKYLELTAVEKKAADFILENQGEIISMSVARFAKSAGVAESAIIRLSKTLGFNGYSALKLSLAMEVSKNKQLNFMPYIARNDDASAILDKVFSANVKTLHDTAEKLDRKALLDIVEMLYDAETIYIYAVGTSAPLATDFQYRLMQFGFRAFCFTDIANMKISTLNIKKGDAVVAISHSGRTKVTVDTLCLAKEKGAKTACITSYSESLITKKCDFSLSVFSDEVNYPIEAVSARAAHMSVLDTIAVSMSAKNFDEAENRFRISHELVNTIRYEGKMKNNER